MTMTEEEARKKWCHQARWVVTSDGNGHTNHPHESGGYCIASECMAWRWVPEPHPDADVTQVAIKLVRVRGYCGLAGPT